MNKIIFWDFDGVIADTFHQSFTIVKMVYPDMTELEYRARFEGNINKTLLRTPPVREINFFEEFEKTIFNAPLTEGIASVIQELSKRYSNIIISSTLSDLIDRYLIHNNLRQYFAEIMGNEVAHSKTEKLTLAFDKHTTSNKHSLLITDTLGDIREANEVQVPVIAVPWGFQTRETLEKGNPTIIVENTNELLNKVNEMLSV